MKAEPQKKKKPRSPAPAKSSESGFQESFTWAREFLESLAVALILAFLFRGFVAEAFVIPTGSMAPTLMGAHKDVTCEQCGYEYQSGASGEFDKNGAQVSFSVVATTCPNCRFEMTLDLKTDANERTFSGDRILVSKFAYLWNEPSRWDVIVFKYPRESRQNYIKRLVGRPEEDLRIQHGDVFIRGNSETNKDLAVSKLNDGFEIARKTPNVVKETLQIVRDTAFQPSELVEAGVPSTWQPFPERSSDTEIAWSVDQSVDSWSANVDASQSTDPVWLRYFHRVVDRQTWDEVVANQSPPISTDPRPTRLITDFTHYNTGLIVSRKRVYNGAAVLDSYDEEGPVSGSTNRESRSGISENDGIHWVPDLAEELDLTLLSDTGKVHLKLVAHGVNYLCEIDIATGVARLKIRKGNVGVKGFHNDDDVFSESVEFPTVLNGAGNYRLRYANVDEQLLLWIDGTLQNPFTKSISLSGARILGSYASDEYLTPNERYPHWLPSDPLDASPLAIGVSGAKAELARAAVYRDLYYVATRGDGYNDYQSLAQTLYRSTQTAREGNETEHQLLELVLTRPALWKSSPYFLERRSVAFTLGKDQYFPMGDNSPASLDARAWVGQKYVPERLLIGRAILVFWPHFWNRPVPFTPNIERMGLIH